MVLVLCLLRWVVRVLCLDSGSGGGVKRVRLYRKTPAHLARQGISVGPGSSQGLEETSGSTGF